MIEDLDIDKKELVKREDARYKIPSQRSTDQLLDLIVDKIRSDREESPSLKKQPSKNDSDSIFYSKDPMNSMMLNAKKGYESDDSIDDKSNLLPAIEK